MKPKSKIYLYDFDIFVPRCEIHLKFPCTFFLTWTQGIVYRYEAKNSVSTIKEPVMRENNIIPFNANLRLSCEMVYDCAQ
jgi:hypothetical protein